MTKINAFDYEALFATINKKIKEDLEIAVTTESNIEKISSFPFATMQVVNPHKDQGYSKFATPYFDIYVNYNAHSDDELQSLTVGDQLRNWFKSAEVRYLLEELNNIYIVKITDNMVINNALSIGYDFRNQFSVVLRVKSVEIDETQLTIEHLETPTKENEDGK